MRTYALLAFVVAFGPACGGNKSRHTDAADAAPSHDGAAAANDANAYTGATVARQGRFLANNGNQQTNWAGASVTVRARGKQVVLRAASSNSANYNQTLDVIVDGKVQATPVVIRSANNAVGYPLALPDDGAAHVVTWRLRTEASYSNAPLTLLGDGVTATDAELLPTPAPKVRQLEVIGDSISNGYGVLGKVSEQCSSRGDAENSSLAYGPLLAASFGADFRLIASSGRGVYRNLSKTADSPPNAQPMTVRTLFGTTLHPYLSAPPAAAAADLSAAGTYSAQADGWAPGIVVINLGTNDFSRRTDDADNASALPDATAFADAYAGLIGDVLAQYPKAAVVPCLGPMLSDTMSVVAEDANGTLRQQPGQTDAATKPLSNARSGIAAAIAQARSAHPAATVTDLVEFATQDVTQSACDAHPNAATHAAMAARLHDAIVAASLAGWTNEP
jgi:lysophospholipase L1-like esterase